MLGRAPFFEDGINWLLKRFRFMFLLGWDPQREWLDGVRIKPGMNAGDSNQLPTAYAPAPVSRSVPFGRWCGTLGKFFHTKYTLSRYTRGSGPIGRSQ